MNDFNTTIVIGFIVAVLFALLFALYTKLSLWIFTNITTGENICLFMFCVIGAPLIVYYLVKFIRGER